MNPCWTAHCFVAVVALWLTSTSLADEVIVDRTGRQQVLYEDSHALLIGASQYEHASWNDLQKVSQELEAVGTALERRGFTVHMVRDPTEQEFRDQVETFIDDFGYETNNRLLVFYSGHGETIDGNGYLVPVDAPDPVLDRGGFLRKAVPMSDVMAWARKIRAKHALFLFDSCFSGALFTARSRPTPEYIMNSTNRPVRQFITAGDEDDEVPSVSVFTPLFVAALEGQADFTGDGYVTGSELGLFLLNKVPEVEVGQTQPQYGKIRDSSLSQGDFVFLLEPVRPNPATVEATLNLSLYQRIEIQRQLKRRKFDTGGIDGLFGPKTRSAIVEWQQGRGYEPTGYLTPSQYRELFPYFDMR